MILKENIELANKLNPWAYVLTVIIRGAVFGMRYFKIPLETPLSFLPTFHSTVNALTAVVLLVALYFIKAKNIKAHRNAIMTAMALSLLFLLSYVAYHITAEETKYCGEGVMRSVYFVLLITHILSAAIIFPFILFTFMLLFIMGSPCVFILEYLLALIALN